MQMIAFGIGLEVTMGGCSFFDVHYGITGINLETSNIDELGKSTDKNQVCLLNARFIIQCTVYRGGGGEGGKGCHASHQPSDASTPEW